MISGVLLDISGVLYAGREPIPGAAAALGRLRTSGLPLRLVTNTTRSPKRDLLEKLGRLGFPVDDGEVFTAPEAAKALLRERGLTPFLLTTPALREDFAEFAGKARDAVVVGDAGDGFTYRVLNEAFRLLMSGAPLIAMAANRYFRDDDGLSLDAGPFVACLEHAATVEATVVGKPSAAFYHSACAAMGSAPPETVMVGDDVEADVNGAIAAGLQATLVRTGKYRDEDEDRLAEGARSCADFAAAVEAILMEVGHV